MSPLKNNNSGNVCQNSYFRTLKETYPNAITMQSDLFAQVWVRKYELCHNN